MIVGFPGETDADFEDTLTLTAAVGYHSMFSFKYSPRPNTLADKRLPDDVSEDEKTRRIVALQALQREIQGGLNERLVGRTVDVLVDAGEPAARDGAVRADEHATWSSTCRARRRGSGARFAVRVERAGPHSVWGRRHD